MFKKKEDKPKKTKQQLNQEDRQSKYEEREEISMSHDSNMIENQQNQYYTKQNRGNTGSKQEDLMLSQQNNQPQTDKLSQINSKIQNQPDSQVHKVTYSGVNEKISTKVGSKVTYNKKNLIDMINLGLSQHNIQLIQYKFQAPYQLALIYITWIFFGFCFIMREEYDGGSSSNDSSSSGQSDSSSEGIDDEERTMDRRKVFAISGLLMLMGTVGLATWKFVIMKRKVRLAEITSIQRLFLMLVFFFSQILVMEAFVLKQNIADSWVITATIVQMSYIQSISRVNLFNLIYIGISTVYLIIRFQFIVEWEWQSLLYSVLVCTVIVFHQEKLQVEKQKQTKKMMSTNQKAHRLNNLYYDILGMIPEGVAIFDKNQSTIFCNKTIKDLFKCKKDQLNKILLGLSTNQQHNPSPQPSPNNNNQFNSSTHNLQSNQQQQYFKSSTSNQQKEQQQQMNYFSQQQSIKPTYNNANNSNGNSILPNSNILNNNSTNNLNDNFNSLIYGQENIKDDASLSMIQSNLQQPSNTGSNRLIQYKNDNQLKNINTSNLQRQSNELSDNYHTLTEYDKRTIKTKTFDQQKSIFTPSFKGPDSMFNNVEIPQNPTFSKLQTKELASPLESKGANTHQNAKDEQLQQQSPIQLKYKQSSGTQNAQSQSPTKSNVIVNSNLVYSNQPYQNSNLNSVSENMYLGQDMTHSPLHNPSHQQGFFIETKGILSGGGDLMRSVRGTDQNSNNEPMVHEGNSILSNNQLISQPQLSQISPRKQQSLHKKMTHPLINASSQRNEDEEESDIDIFNNYIYQQEGQKIFKKRLFNQKKSNDIIQGETKVGDILTDLFSEIAGQRINNSQANYNSQGLNNNNLDPTIQSPNNHNGFTFVNQSANNVNNKDIPLTPTSVKKPDYGKSKTFFSQMNKNTNLGYMQFQEDMIKVQVRWKDQIFVIKFLLFEIETSENSSEIFILVLVDPLWQEYYNKRMEEVQKYKMKMFASLSHELRTPLNCTISMLEGLEQFISDPNLIDDYLYPALHSQKLLLNQINDILDFAQIDSGKFKYTFVDFNLEKLLQDCQTLIQMQANVKSLDLQLIYDTRLNLIAKSDPNRIRQILLNFLSNSLKFTPENGVIKIIAEPMFVSETNKVQKYIRLAVQDTGIGMKPETLQNIFNAFNKTEYENEGMNSQGCGLGLAISQSISKGLCSQNFLANSFSPQTDYQISNNLIGIQVESIVNQGSTFSFIIQDMNPKPLLHPQYSHNNSYTHSVLPLDMINEEDLANSYISVKNDNNLGNSNPNSQRQNAVSNGDITSKLPKEEKDISMFADSACIQEGSIDQNKQPQFMELGHFFDGHYRSNNDIASIGGQASPIQKPLYPLGITATNIYGINSYSPLNSQNKTSENQQYIQSQQSSSTSTFQSLNKFNQSTQNSINAQLYNNNNINNNNNNIISNSNNNNNNNSNNHNNSNNSNTTINNNNSIQSQKLIQSVANNQITVVTIETDEQFKNNMLPVNEMQRNSSTPTNQNQNQSQNKNNLLTENAQQRFSSSGSISNFYSNSSKVIPSTSKLTSNLSRTLTNKSLSKMNSAQGFNGYHSKSNLNEMEGAKLMVNLSQYIENTACENKCSSILIVDDNQFNILALGRMLQQFFNVPVDKAFDGKQAYEKICAKYTTNKLNCSRCTKYEIVFMDIEMPIMNGYEVMKEVIDFFSENKIDRAEYPYIIACTAHGGDQEQVRAKMSGFDDYISKPIMKNDMQKLLCDWYYYAHYQHHSKVNKQNSLMGLNSLPSDK